MSDFLSPRAIPGVEAVKPDRYRRTVVVDDSEGLVEIQPVLGESMANGWRPWRAYAVMRLWMQTAVPFTM